MARLKRGSQTLVKAQHRASRLHNVDARLNMGAGVSLAAFRRDMARTEARLEAYNFLLAQADGALIDLVQAEKRLADLSERLLQGVAARYGRDSGKYEIAGGTAKSEVRRRQQRRAAQRAVARPASKVVALVAEKFINHQIDGDPGERIVG